MSAAVLLTTMRCNISCAHCSVDSHPRRAERMSVGRALGLLRGLSKLPGIQHVDVSGGEPLIHLADVKELAREARRLGISLRVTSNGFWAVSREKARLVLADLSEAGVGAVGLSIDEWHLPFVGREVVGHYIGACRDLDLQPVLSAVVRGVPSEAAEGRVPEALGPLLEAYGLDSRSVLDSHAWGLARERLSGEAREAFECESRRSVVLFSWQILTGEGRGGSLQPGETPFGSGPKEACRAAGDLPTVDEQGRLFPCCAPWVSRKGHAFGSVDESTVVAGVERMRATALVRWIHDRGPETLIEALREAGVAFPACHSGICNQCGLLLDRLPLPVLEAVATMLWDRDANGEAWRVLGLTPRVTLRDLLNG